MSDAEDGTLASADVDAFYGRLLAAGDDAARMRSLLDGEAIDDALLLAVLRRAVPPRFLEELAQTRPWSERSRLQGAIALNPACSRALAQRLLPGLLWSDLATLAVTPSADSAIRVRAEALLQERLPEMRLGERMTLARRATPPVLRLLLQDRERQVTRAALENSRLREDDLVVALRDPAVSVALISEAPISFRWKGSYAVRRTLLLQPRTPLAVALSLVTALQPADLRRLGAEPGVHPLLRAAARRAAAGPGSRGGGPAI